MKVILNLSDKNVILSYEVLSEHPDFSKAKDPDKAKDIYIKKLGRSLELEKSQFKSIICGQTMFINGKIEEGIDLTPLYIELNQIQSWLKENDWKVNKIALGEWKIEDEKAVDYLLQRKIKRDRQDKILKELGN